MDTSFQPSSYGSEVVRRRLECNSNAKLFNFGLARLARIFPLRPRSAWLPLPAPLRAMLGGSYPWFGEGQRDREEGDNKLDKKSFTKKAYIFSVRNPVRKWHTSAKIFPLRGRFRKEYIIIRKSHTSSKISGCVGHLVWKSYMEKAYIFKNFPAAGAFFGKKSYTEKAYIFKKFPAARAF